MPGYIKIHRQILDSKIWNRKEKYSSRDAFIYILLSANWKKGRFCQNGHIFEVDRGQFLTSIRHLSQTFGWSRNRLLRFLRNWELMEIGTVSSTGFGTLITVANYSKYQGDGGSIGATNEATSGTLLGQERNHFGDSTGTASDTTNEASSSLEKSSKSGNDGDSLGATLGIGSDLKKGQSRSKTGIQYKKYKNKEVEESILTDSEDGSRLSLDARSRPRDGLLKDGEGYAFATSDESDGSEDGFFTFEEHEERKRRGLE